MKKSLVALAVLAAAGAASAQSSVTLFGVIDANIGHISGSNGGASRTYLGNSGLNTSRLGFRGVEDLGGGLAASFWLEGFVGNDDGTGGASTTATSPTTGLPVTTNNGGFDFRRRATVSLSGNFGEVRLGRDLTPTHHNDDLFSPFGTVGVGSNIIFSALNSAQGFNPNGGNSAAFGNVNQIRASNSIGYFLPSNLGGFYGQAMYALAENTTGNTTAAQQLAGRAGQYAGARVGYANGPVDVALAYGESKGATVAPAAFSNPEVRTLNLGASYDFGVVKLFGELSDVRFEQAFTTIASREDKQYGYLLGAQAPIGAGVVKIAYSAVKRDQQAFANDPKAAKLALGYVHNLSKRTALYTTVARQTSKNGYGFALASGGSGAGITGVATGTDAKNSVTGYEFGVRHAF
ncbi:porin [Variovorax sp. PvP013]|jgi:predicted porin|uniref:porin n=1 Tax=Variovorax sp. PvP013 TaxID=3156435 RepID=UPI003D1BD893